MAGSYGQVFFSLDRRFAFLLFAASFTDPAVGLAGLIAVVFSLGLAILLDLDPAFTSDGSFTFNSLLTGLALGTYFQMTGNFLMVLLLASFLTLLITVCLAALGGRFSLPFLSIPFVLAVWIIILNFTPQQSGILLLRPLPGNDIAFGYSLLSANTAISSFFDSAALVLYLKTMSAVFFQTNILAGALITLGLLIHSRIAFLLSITGFLCGQLSFYFVQGAHADPSFQLVAPSFVLSAIGIGGFFLISSLRSFLLVIFFTPIVGLLAGSMIKLLALFSLPLYSLPFSVAVIILLSFVHRLNFKNVFQPVQYQLYSPEKNLYAFVTYMERFKKETSTIIHLPFFGEWTVSQGHQGKLTHKKDWRFAWDFVVEDEFKKTFRLPGKAVSDFYCYSLPVLCPADGEVVTIHDGIDDNEIGNVNLAKNWGNTIVIKHADHLFSKLSHLKKESFKVKEGDFVKKGDILALCGNSGRSPEPHIHFQLQASPHVGAPTINYPVSYYGRKAAEGYQFNFFEVPEEGDILVKPVPAIQLKKAFNFIPGVKLKFAVNDGVNAYDETWEVVADAYNNTALVCKRTNAKAYFKFDDTLFYFTGFTGSTDALLYYFYLGAYKVLLCPFNGLQVNDRLSIEGTHKGTIKFLQDFCAPFYIFLKPVYSSSVDEQVSETGTDFKIISKVSSNLSGKNARFEILVSGNKISEITIKENDKCIIAKNILSR